MEVHLERSVVARVEDSGALRARGGTVGPIRGVLLDARGGALDLASAGGQLLAHPRTPSSPSVGIKEVHACCTGGSAYEEPLHGR
jgi:hypothetical protein